jgi:hypothetical protein
MSASRTRYPLKQMTLYSGVTRLAKRLGGFSRTGREDPDSRPFKRKSR